MVAFHLQYFAFGGWWTVAYCETLEEAMSLAKLQRKRTRIAERIINFK